MIKTPKFWYHGDTLLSKILTPLSYVYLTLSILNRFLTKTRSLDSFVICVGNAVAGGAGKTPATLYLAKLLKKLDCNPHVVIRGYGGQEQGPHLVSNNDPFSQVGDEALLLEKQASTWVSKKRYKGARAAVEAGASAILLDDGLQNASLKKNLSFLVVDGPRGFGNERLLPAGPLRESQKSALSKVDAVILIGEDRHNLTPRFQNLPVFHGSLRTVGSVWENLKKKKIIAFAGIAHPSKFFETLRQQGCALIGQRPFGDHHPYQGSDLRPLIQRAAEEKATLVTTEKDFIRVPTKYQSHITPMPVELVIEEEKALLKFLKQSLVQFEEDQKSSPKLKLKKRSGLFS